MPSDLLSQKMTSQTLSGLYQNNCQAYTKSSIDQQNNNSRIQIHILNSLLQMVRTIKILNVPSNDSFFAKLTLAKTFPAVVISFVPIYIPRCVSHFCCYSLLLLLHQNKKGSTSRIKVTVCGRCESPFQCCQLYLFRNSFNKICFPDANLCKNGYFHG